MSLKIAILISLCQIALLSPESRLFVSELWRNSQRITMKPFILWLWIRCQRFHWFGNFLLICPFHRKTAFTGMHAHNNSFHFIFQKITELPVGLFYGVINEDARAHQWGISVTTLWTENKQLTAMRLLSWAECFYAVLSNSD